MFEWLLGEKPVAEFCDMEHQHHSDVVLDKTVLPSVYEQMDAETRRSWCEDEYMEESYFVKKLVLVLKCERCGRVATLTETNP